MLHAGKLPLTAITIFAFNILGKQLSKNRYILPIGIFDQSKPTQETFMTSKTHYQSKGGLQNPQHQTISFKQTLCLGISPKYVNKRKEPILAKINFICLLINLELYRPPVWQIFHWEYKERSALYMLLVHVTEKNRLLQQHICFSENCTAWPSNSPYKDTK